MANNQTSRTRDLWLAKLKQLQTFEDAAIKAKDSKMLIAAMQTAYPSLTNLGDLSLSAKVILGEMQWP